MAEDNFSTIMLLFENLYFKYEEPIRMFGIIFLKMGRTFLKSKFSVRLAGNLCLDLATVDGKSFTSVKLLSGHSIFGGRD